MIPLSRSHAPQKTQAYKIQSYQYYQQYIQQRNNGKRSNKHLTVCSASSAPSTSGVQDQQNNDLSEQQQLPHELLEDKDTFDPSEYRLPAGQLSYIKPVTEEDRQAYSNGAEKPWEQEEYYKQIVAATLAVYKVAIETPLQEADRINLDCNGSKCNNQLYLKREDMQPVFSFKLRGAFNMMSHLSQEELQRGVICSSAGNHAQGVALAAKHMGCESTICMPKNTPEIKVSAVRALGGTVKLVGESYTETQTSALAQSKEEGLPFVAPYDNPYTIAGQGTIGLEILQQCAAQNVTPDVVFVAIGGGGLVAGVAVMVKYMWPNCKVIGVEPAGANCMAISCAKGKRVTLSKVDTFADGVAVKTVGVETFRLCRELLDGIVLVDNADISAAIEQVFNQTRTILEPAGACSVAGARAYLSYNGLSNQKCVAVTSGANINFRSLRLVTELAEVGQKREVTLACVLPERVGAFRDFLEAALRQDEVDVTEFRYRGGGGGDAKVLVSFGLDTGRGLSVGKVIHSLQEAGYQSVDVSKSQVCQQHVKHLVGGRWGGLSKDKAQEIVLLVQFPERMGSLRKFVNVMCPPYDLTMFHYRSTGSRVSSVLLGMEVGKKEEEVAAFWELLGTLGGDFTVSELNKNDKQVFDMFLGEVE